MKTTCAAITLDANLLCCSRDSHPSPHCPKLLEVTGSGGHEHLLLSYLFRPLDMLVSYTKQQIKIGLGFDPSERDPVRTLVNSIEMPQPYS
jgi:hypothetical protein